MGLFEFLKSKLVDEEEEYIDKEVEVPVEKKVEPKVEVVKTPNKLPTILREELKNNSLNITKEKSRELPTRLVDLQLPATKEEVTKYDAENNNNRIYKSKKVEKPKLDFKVPKKSVIDSERHFRPSKVISPVYGVLDKNYRKEDITIKSEESYEIPRRKKITYEDVRRKAYGTLTDELEMVLSEDQEKINDTIRSLDELLNDINVSKQNLSQTTVDEIETKVEEIMENPESIEPIIIKENYMEEPLKSIDIVKIVDHNNNETTEVVQEVIASRSEYHKNKNYLEKQDDAFAVINNLYQKEVE